MARLIVGALLRKGSHHRTGRQGCLGVIFTPQSHGRVLTWSVGVESSVRGLGEGGVGWTYVILPSCVGERVCSSHPSAGGVWPCAAGRRSGRG